MVQKPKTNKKSFNWHPLPPPKKKKVVFKKKKWVWLGTSQILVASQPGSDSPSPSSPAAADSPSANVESPHPPRNSQHQLLLALIEQNRTNHTQKPCLFLGKPEVFLCFPDFFHAFWPLQTKNSNKVLTFSSCAQACTPPKPMGHGLWFSSFKANEFTSWETSTTLNNLRFPCFLFFSVFLWSGQEKESWLPEKDLYIYITSGKAFHLAQLST